MNTEIYGKTQVGLKNFSITSAVLQCFYRIYSVLGYGFLEKVYENAMVIELTRKQLDVRQQSALSVEYDGFKVGNYYADLIVEGRVIVEVKAAEAICDAHVAQLLNYLKCTRIEVGLVLNFGPKPAFKRKIYTNDRKGTTSMIRVHQ